MLSSFRPFRFFPVGLFICSYETTDPFIINMAYNFGGTGGVV